MNPYLRLLPLAALACGLPAAIAFGVPRLVVSPLPAAAIGEIHLAGHSVVTRGGRTLLIDDHGSPVAPAVWRLYGHVLARAGLVPSLVEWDKALPPFGVLLSEARAAALIAEEAIDAVAAE